MLYQFFDPVRVASSDFQLSNYRPIFTRLSNYFGGLEIEQAFEVMSHFGACDDLASFEKTKTEFPIIDVEKSVNPELWKILGTLQQIEIDITLYWLSFSLLERQRALLRVNPMLTQLELSLEIKTWLPERFILKQIIDRWQKLVREESGRVGGGESDRPIPNPYIAGNPVTGDLFVGREDIMRTLQESWSASGQCPSVVLFGHRRMGKSSILQNLKTYLSPHQIVIDFNMELVGMIENTRELLYLLALEIYHGLPLNQQQNLVEPDQTTFLENNPYNSFRRFLDRLDRIRQGYQVIIAVDEFEVLEELLQKGRLEPQLLNFWRALFQTYQWFIMVFAGLHTLDELCRDFWSPRFGSVKLIPVGFLTPKATRLLIERPSPISYTLEAIEEIIQLTNGQPYLIQLICQNLVTHFNDQIARGKQQFTHDDVVVIIQSSELFGYGFAYFDGVWARVQDSKPPGQAELLKHLYQGPLSLPELAAVSGLSLEQVQAALETLEYHDMIKNVKGRYAYTVELMRRWVQKQQ